MKINAIITDFDGTLVDTFLANFYAYNEAFKSVGLNITEEQYKKCYGLRFPEFMKAMNVPVNLQTLIKEKKAQVYLNYSYKCTVNIWLKDFIINQHKNGVKTAIASTASKNNLIGILQKLGLTENMFDLILTGEDITYGKPNPEVYNKAMNLLNVTPEETLIFEDSDTGLEAAHKSLANYIKV